MPLICYIPILIAHDGTTIRRLLQYNSSNLKKYDSDLRKLAYENFEEFECDRIEDKQEFLQTLKELITRVSKFWLYKVIVPLSEEMELPDVSVCHCCNHRQELRKCAQDLMVSSHVDEETTSRIKVDLFSAPPTISINIASQEEADIERLKRYYSHLIKRHHELPCCSCCPISKALIMDIK